jgi:polyphenol oxidase
VTAPALYVVDAAPAGVRALFSGGDLDVGTAGPGDRGDVARNRLRLAGAAGFDADRAVVLRQVHGASAVVVGGEGGRGVYARAVGGLTDGDATVTRAPGVALLALGADCAPVLLWSADGPVVAAVHAGWRGLVAGVIPAAVTEMAVDPAGIRAAIGPCVGPCCYPVDTALRRTMAHLFGEGVVRGDAVDLTNGVRRSLMQAGLADAAVSAVGGCTACDPGRWFSYRRDGDRAGRQAGIVWIEEAA